ncbi:Urease accessory protein UreE [Chryseobacterium nakagawai]|uniref:Urease accessory protein UreE n=1 Tax=Chryseobacterium nakagawai TaxID=1241982 RepID=A0AAD0YSS2_CHRNA|nr:urease accessory protein UreE [Chryseobacterium nakagawai]AZA93533.1 urease accessory protein UreE [Chryseobacterium nakagawai]VEH20223.1 Urease accessory protein UreE [Chryseobacterium nakagawai]
MNTVQPIVIDEIKTGIDLNHQCSDVLELEWFENKKQKLTRITKSGVVLELKLKNRKEWQQGDRLYNDGQLMATILIKTCLTICFSTENNGEAADFCYFIGNQHLPVFLISHKKFAVPYDGRLYEQLSLRYGKRIELMDAQLLSHQSLRYLAKNRIYEN